MLYFWDYYLIIIMFLLYEGLIDMCILFFLFIMKIDNGIWYILINIKMIFGWINVERENFVMYYGKFNN